MSCGIGNFNYANPTRILFGRGQIAQLPNLIDKDRLVFMTYGGGSIKRNGVYDQVMKALEGYEITECSGVQANPDFDPQVKAVDQIRKLDMSRVFLLPVGGGSVAYGTKFIAAACQYTKSEDLWELILSAGAGVEVAIPMGCVMTLPAGIILLLFFTSRQVPKATGVLSFQEELLTYFLPFPIMFSANTQFTVVSSPLFPL